VVVAWVTLLLAGVGAAALASRRAVEAALEVSDALGVSAGLVGVTVLAIGTDLPEIANSISASVSGHGDLNVGDSTGSALTQITLVLAILLIAAGSRLDLRRPATRIATTTGIATVAALVALALLLSDRTLGRLDGLLLVGGWGASMVVVHRREGATMEAVRQVSGVGRAVVRALAWLVAVGGAAAIVVRSFVELSDRFGVPEFVASALVLSLGTSLPELVVDWTAIRRGASALALGDLFGSSLVDSTLSVGIGPVIRPTLVSHAALTGTLVIAAGCAVATVVVTRGRRAGPITFALLSTYVVTSTLLVAVTT